MGIDPAMATAMLGTFRDLLSGARSDGLTGADIEQMATALAAMESLATQVADVGEFSTTLANGGYYTRFTDAYTRAMIAAGGGSAAAGADGSAAPIPADVDLLAQALGAYETSLSQLRGLAGQQEAVAALERIIAIGRSGVTYPVFLRCIEDEALNETLTGSITPSRAQLIADVDRYRTTVDPAREAHAQALLAMRDQLAARSPIGSVDPFGYELHRFELTYRHAPAIALRDLVVARLPRLIDLILDWLDAHTSWAPHDNRFGAGSPAHTRERIEMARECNPGFYEIRAGQFASYFGQVPWWQRAELHEERRAGRILWTDARVSLAMDAVPACVPGADAPPALVARAEAFGPNSF
jgi:hypothetical protein